MPRVNLSKLGGVRKPDPVLDDATMREIMRALDKGFPLAGILRQLHLSGTGNSYYHVHRGWRLARNRKAKRHE